MPTFRHGKLTEVLLDDKIASPYFKSASAPRVIETVDTTGFGADGGAKSYTTGMNSATISLGGMFDGTIGAIDEFFDSVTAIEGNYTASLFYDGGIKPGRSCRFGSVKNTSYDVTAPVGDIVSISTELIVDGRLGSGLCLTDKVQRNATFIHPIVDWGPNSGAVGNGFAAIHIPHNTRNVATNVIIQHSSDNTVWVDAASQSVSASTTGSFVIPVPGNINRYTRANIVLTTGTGTVSAIVAFARN